MSCMISQRRWDAPNIDSMERFRCWWKRYRNWKIKVRTDKRGTTAWHLKNCDKKWSMLRYVDVDVLRGFRFRCLGLLQVPWTFECTSVQMCATLWESFCRGDFEIADGTSRTICTWIHTMTMVMRTRKKKTVMIDDWWWCWWWWYCMCMIVYVSGASWGHIAGSSPSSLTVLESFPAQYW